MYLSKP